MRFVVLVKMCLVSSLFVLASCAAGNRGTSPEALAHTVQATDGSVRLSVPGNWKQIEGLNDVAVLQLADPGSDIYGIVINDHAEDFTDFGSFVNIAGTNLIGTL